VPDKSTEQLPNNWAEWLIFIHHCCEIDSTSALNLLNDMKDF